jgi:hypothetical protein
MSVERPSKRFLGLDELMVRLEGERPSVLSGLALVLLAMSVVLSAAALGAGKEDSLRHTFRLVKGRGVPVCEGYLDLLNRTDFLAMPFCGRPDGDPAHGFQMPERHYLTAGEIWPLFDRVYRFTHFGDQGYDKKFFHPNMNPEKSFWSENVEDETNIKEMVQGRELVVWTYSVGLDLDNNGTSDRVLLWLGYGAGDSSGVCGALYASKPWDFPYLPQRAFVLTADGKRIDEARTRAIFGATGTVASGKVGIAGKPALHVLADSVGIFRYRGRYYIDTERTPKLKNGPSPIDVYSREGGHTKQQCSLLF